VAADAVAFLTALRPSGADADVAAAWAAVASRAAASATFVQPIVNALLMEVCRPRGTAC
jgi:hypothetical protein